MGEDGVEIVLYSEFGVVFVAGGYYAHGQFLGGCLEIVEGVYSVVLEGQSSCFVLVVLMIGFHVEDALI